MMDWDNRTETTVHECMGGPWDGQTCPMPPGLRTVRAAQWRGGYYEITRHRGDTMALMWHPASQGAIWPFHTTGTPPEERGDG